MNLIITWLLLIVNFQDILRQSSVQVHIEVRPKYLIPDTNCFIDSCESLVRIAEAYPLFQLLVPLVGKWELLLTPQDPYIS